MNSKDYAARLADVLGRYPHASYVAVVDRLERARTEDGTLYTIGNGGSASTASHMVADFANLCGWPIHCLADNVPRLTATANDRAYDDIYAQALAPLVRQRDVVLAFSGSGNSPNVLAAVRYARTLGVWTVGFTGMGGGQLARLVDVPLVVPSDDMQLIEDTHLATVHMLTQYFRTRVQ